MEIQKFSDKDYVIVDSGTIISRFSSFYDAWLFKLILASASSEDIEFNYLNWKGETYTRTIRVISVWHGRTIYYAEDQWLIKALDLDDLKIKNFSLKSIQE